MNIVLFEPEIPANTGNIARLAVISGSSLHLIRPFGFFLDDKRMKRAGLDYWDYLNLQTYDSWDDFLSKKDQGNIFLVETGSTKLYSEVEYDKNDFLVFGSETKGIPQTILEKYSDNHISLPMKINRSLNLSNTVAIIVYEAWRQHAFSAW